MESYKLTIDAPNSRLVALRHALRSLLGIDLNSEFVTDGYLSVQVDVGEFMAQVSAVDGGVSVEVALMQPIDPNRLLAFVRLVSSLLGARELYLFSALDEQNDLWELNDPGLQTAIESSLEFRKAEWKRMVPGKERKGTLADACTLLVGGGSPQ